MLSLFIGLLIGVTATVSRTIGAGQMLEARALATSSLVLVAAIAAGRGLPFVLTAAAFVFVWIVAFQWRTWPPTGRLRGLATAAAIAVGSSTVIAYLFQAVFLVRLP